MNRHHFVPRSRGGRETVPVHRICHAKIHSLWSERELETSFASPEAVRAHPDMAAFVRWLGRKPPEFYSRTKTAGSRRRR